MAYTKNKDPWAADDLLTTAVLDNFETIYSEASSYLTSHTHDDLYQTKSEMEAAYWYAGNDGSGSGSDADLLYKSSGNLHAASFAGLGVPTGLIILWYGSTGSIPSGWHICDGTGGTIDLRNRFPVCAGTGSDYSVGDTGGSITFTSDGTITVAGHAVTTTEMAAHNHPFSDRGNTSYGLVDGGPGGWLGDNDRLATTTGNTSSAGSGDVHGHSSGEGTAFSGNAVTCMPYYYALCYIQKV